MTNHYRVWTAYQQPQDGCTVRADTSFEARKRIQKQRNIADFTDIMAARIDPDKPIPVEAMNGKQWLEAIRLDF